MEKLIQVAKAKFCKGSVLAITANSGGFRLCELVEDLYDDEVSASIRFYSPAGSRYSDNSFYKPLSTAKEQINQNLIITSVKMCSISRVMSKLPDSEIDKITSVINESYVSLKSLLPSITENASQNNHINTDDFDVNNFNIINVGLEEGKVESLQAFSQNPEKTPSFDGNIENIINILNKSDFGQSENLESSYQPSYTDSLFSDVSKLSLKPKNLKRKIENKLNSQEKCSSIVSAPSKVNSRSVKILNSTPSFEMDNNSTPSCEGVSHKSNLKSSCEVDNSTSSSKVDNLKSSCEVQNSTTGCDGVKSQMYESMPSNVKKNDNKETGVYFNNVTKKEENKRVYNKKHVCLYCDSFIGKVTRHLSSKHKSENEVAKLLALPVGCEDRKNGFLELLRMGDFYHNCNVLAVKEGELILVRRPSEKESKLVSYKDFGPCPGCTGFMLKKHLWHHTRECSFLKNKNVINKNIVQQSNALISAVLNPYISEQFRKNVLDKLLDDEVGKVAKSDETIVAFGMMMVEKHEEEQYELTRQSMRQLARLLIGLHITTQNSGAQLKDLIKPSHFDDIILAVRHVSGIQTTSEKKIPSLALKLGYHIQKCAAILRGKALRQGDTAGDKSYKDFLDLYSLEWQIRISSSALNVMNKSQINSVKMIPLTSDLMKINSALTSQLKDMIKGAGEGEMSTEKWLQLAKLTLCRLIMFNKKRGGEAAKITLLQYASKPDWSGEYAENFQEHLSELERHLLDKLTLIEIRGKHKNIVPVLLTEDVNKAISILINTREAAGVSKYNPYIFARPYCDSLQALRGSDCLREFTNTLELQKPELIKSTKLRRYIATISQVFNLQENEVDWLARHLGHDIKVHRNFYRIHHSAIELTKVSKLLMAVDQGKATEFAGKTLDQLNVEDLFDGDEECEIDKEGEHGDEEDDPDFGEGESATNNASDTEDDITPRPKRCKIKKKRKTGPTAKVRESVSDEDMADPTYEPEVCAKDEDCTIKSKSRKTNVTPRMTWSDALKKKALQFFRQDIIDRKVPGKAVCTKFINSHEELKDVHWKKVKQFVHNYLNKIKKKLA